MWRWNPDTRKWDIPYTPEHREYPHLPPHIKTELIEIEPTHDGMMEYFPCLVLLENGQQHDCVYIAEAKSYIRFWGVWPDHESRKRAIRIEDVAQIRPSPSRLPVRFTRAMYAVGESRMGCCIFTLRFTDGTRQSYCAGNLIDFPKMPIGKSVRDVVAITPNEGDETDGLGTREYYWCLFSEPPRHSVI